MKLFWAAAVRKADGSSSSGRVGFITNRLSLYLATMYFSLVSLRVALESEHSVRVEYAEDYVSLMYLSQLSDGLEKAGSGTASQICNGDSKIGMLGEQQQQFRIAQTCTRKIERVYCNTECKGEEKETADYRVGLRVANGAEEVKNVGLPLIQRQRPDA